MYFGFALLFRRWSIRAVAAVAFSFSVCIELGQLYHAPWIDSLRATRLGGLVLGFSFVWSDLLCYAVGVSLGALIETYCIPARYKQN
ncbi:ribosomal maturation YjgA family protein [Spirosoma pomorum]